MDHLCVGSTLRVQSPVQPCPHRGRQHDSARNYSEQDVKPGGLRGPLFEPAASREVWHEAQIFQQCLVKLVEDFVPEFQEFILVEGGTALGKFGDLELLRRLDAAGRHLNVHPSVVVVVDLRPTVAVVVENQELADHPQHHRGSRPEVLAVPLYLRLFALLDSRRTRF